MEEIVHCKDCKYYHPLSDFNSECGNIHGLLSPSENDFCSLGEYEESATIVGQIRLDS